jgi:hypothetical protein
MTGSLIRGLGNSLGNGLTSLGDQIISITGNPSGILVSAITSGLAYDKTNNKIYMSLNAGSSIWIRLGSTIF